MEILDQLISYILHIDQHLVGLVNDYQYWTYLIMFLIIFAETGLVITPFLPGDSILFALGALIAKPDSDLSISLMLVLLISAAILGDFVNYEIGKYLGRKVFTDTSKIFKTSYLERTELFYEKYGDRTIIYARFVPIIRTFAPFFAGLSTMTYQRFGKFNIVGGILWVSLFLFAGYFFGKIDFVEKNFSFVVVIILLISLIPVLISVIKKQKQ